jgi:cytochrome bd-type quinol oxidase subunit 2
MKSVRCEHEADTSRAVRTGFWSDALRQHAESCTTCSQAAAVTQALLQESARLHTENRPPDAAQAWLEARRRTRLHLRHRALFWFRALRTLTVIYVPALLIWALSHHSSPVHESWKPSFHSDFASLLAGPAVSFAVSGVLLAALCITMGSWYLLREARTPLQHSATR